MANKVKDVRLNNSGGGLPYTAEDVADKGQPNGYAGLDGSGKVPVAQLPANILYND